MQDQPENHQVQDHPIDQGEKGCQAGKCQASLSIPPKSSENIDERPQRNQSPNLAAQNREIEGSSILHRGVVKEIAPSEIVKTTFLRSRTFGSCYLAHYRGLLVTVKEFH